MSAIDQAFSELRASGRKALMPFLTAGDCDIETTEALLRTLDEVGVDICEVGVPYSDPIADGPVIQASYQRALSQGFKVSDLMAMGRRLRSGPQAISMPLVTMVSYSILLRIGIESYVRQAIEGGYSGAIVPDLLVEEGEEIAAICRAHDFSLIHLVTPTTPRPRQLRIASQSTGFLYFVSVTGITGERSSLAPDLIENVTWLRSQTSLPICIGFGISGPEQIRQLAPVADGLIVGSAFVRRIAQHRGDRAATVRSVRDFAIELRAAMETSPSTTPAKATH